MRLQLVAPYLTYASWVKALEYHGYELVSYTGSSDGIAYAPGLSYEERRYLADLAASSVKEFTPVAPVQLWLSCTEPFAADALTRLAPEEFPSEEDVLQ